MGSVIVPAVWIGWGGEGGVRRPGRGREGGSEGERREGKREEGRGHLNYLCSL